MMLNRHALIQIAARLEQAEKAVAALKARVDAAEAKVAELAAKRGPGRPPKEHD